MELRFLLYNNTMPGRNIVKNFAAFHHYHVYNRGVNKGPIFLDKTDYLYFEWLLQRTVDMSPSKDNKGREYIWLRPSVDLEAYCLMPNHFHLLLMLRASKKGAAQLIHSVATSYTMYFNKKYQRRGPLFENSYRAVLVDSDEQLQHVSRYIHLNHSKAGSWPHSSLRDFLQNSRSWIEPSLVLAQFDYDKQRYEEFVHDYEDSQREKERIKRDLY